MPPPVKLPGRTRLTLLASAIAVVALPAAGAQAATDVSVNVKGGGQIPILKKAEITGKLTNPVPSDKVQVTVTANGDTVLSEKLDPKGDGSFSVPLTVEKCCRYVVTAENGNKKAT